MTEAPSATTPEAGDISNPERFPSSLMYAVVGALQADMGCLLGAIGFMVLMALSVIFATSITPCTSAGGIPCAP